MNTTRTMTLAERRLEVIRRNIVLHADTLFTTDPDSGVDEICREVLNLCAEDIDRALQKLEASQSAFHQDHPAW